MDSFAKPTSPEHLKKDIPAEVYAREREIEMGREDLKSKPEAIRAKIAEGRTAKLAQEMTLLPQPFLADQTKTVEQAGLLFVKLYVKLVCESSSCPSVAAVDANSATKAAPPRGNQSNDVAIKEVSAAVGEKISVRRFVKYQLGEGIEKKTSNLAEEVASIAGGSS
eukprot:1158800-Pelagomonas_calceolata.AAC.15